MKNTKIWLFLLFTLVPSLAIAGDSNSTNGNEATQHHHKVEVAACSSSWLTCILSKMLPRSTPTLLGPGVGGDP